MKALNLQYESSISSLKGDIAKMLSKTKNHHIKYMRKLVSNVNKDLNITVMRVDKSMAYDRNRRKKDVFYTRRPEMNREKKDSVIFKVNKYVFM